jgi:hypothetical protein
VRDEIVNFRRGRAIVAHNRYFPYGDIEDDEALLALFPIVRRGKGPYLYDYDENRFVDFELMQGALLLGHAPAVITKTAKGWLSRGYAPGYSNASHRMTSVAINTLLEHENFAMTGKEKFLFFDSPCAAVTECSELVDVTGRAREGILLIGGEAETPAPYRFLRRVKHEEVEDVLSEEHSFIVLRLDGTSTDADVRQVHECAKASGIPVFGDASDFAGFIHIRRCEAYPYLDALLIGSWIAAGFSFCAVCMKGLPAEILHMKNRSRGARSQSGTPAGSFPLGCYPSVYKLKAVQRCVSELGKLGGVQCLLQKHGFMYGSLDSQYFELHGGLIRWKQGASLSSAYRQVRLRLLRGGLYLPVRYKANLSISFCHSDELLKKSAQRLNRLMTDVFK